MKLIFLDLCEIKAYGGMGPVRGQKNRYRARSEKNQAPITIYQQAGSFHRNTEALMLNKTESLRRCCHLSKVPKPGQRQPPVPELRPHSLCLNTPKCKGDAGSKEVCLFPGNVYVKSFLETKGEEEKEVVL